MRTFILTVAMTIGLFGGAAPQIAEGAMTASESVPTTEVFTVCVGTEGHTIDPAYLPDGEAGDYLYHLYEGLMKYAPTDTDEVMNEMEVEYGLAESAELSADGLTYRFTLREDAMWSDGVPVTTHDFVYAWQRLSATDSNGGAQLAAVLKTVTAESDRVLVVTLQRPCPWFPELCAEVYAAPVRRDLVEAYGGDWTDEGHIAVSGPYVIESWVHDDCIVLRKNPYYYDRDSLTTERIVWYFADSTHGVGADFTAEVSDADATGRVEKAGIYYLYLNANAIRDWRVRAAMVLAVDREGIASAVGQGVRPACGLVPEGVGTSSDGEPMLRWLRETYPDYDLSSYEGRCALAIDLYNSAVASGTWSYSRTLRYRYNPSAVNDTVMRRCADDWLRVLGLTVTPQPMTTDDYEKMLATNTFDVAYLSWVADYDDPLCFLQIMERGGDANFSAWGDERYDGLLERCGIEREGREELLYETECALFEAERFAVCPLYCLGETYAAADDVTGIAHSAYGGYRFTTAAKG